MKKRKTILKEAGVLLITAAMVLSTVAVTANTEDDISIGNSQTSFADSFAEVDYTYVENDPDAYSQNRGPVIFSQPYGDYCTGPYSDEAQGYRVYDNFWGLSEDICDVHWWGLIAFGDDDPTESKFEVGYFPDDDGMPDMGSPTATFTGTVGVEISFADTGIDWHGYSLYYFEMDHSCVSMSDGWLSVYRLNDGSGERFAWMDDGAATGDGQAYQDPAGFLQYDLAFELTGETILRFDQVDYYFEECDECIDSYIGQIKVDIVALTSYYEIPTGFLNVMTPMGWVVQNMLISSEFMNEGIPYISTKFGLREGPQCGIDVETLDAYMEFSTTPTPEFYGEDFTTYPVGDTPCYLEGECYDITWPDDIYFPCYPTQICLQFGHPNVQAARNQCAPAAVANSLQWLENMYGINIPHDNVPGIGITGGAVVPPNSLVGQLDHAMRRTGVQSRVTGDGVWPMEGKLRYLDETGLYQSIKVKYQGNVDPGKTKVGNVTAKNKGPVTCQCIIDECKEGEDVELVLHYPSCGRHAVELTGAGWICGVQFIQHVSDQQQTHQGDPTDKKGCDSVQTSYIAEIGGKLVVIGGSDPVGTEIEMVYIQSPNDPPKKPSKPSGPTKVKAGTPQTYTTNPATDPDGDAIQQYEWDFDGDGKVDKVTTTPSVTYTWPNQGTYSVRVRARDEYGAVSDWSDPLSVSVPRNKAYTNTAFLNFLQNHPNLFPILQLLIQLLAL